MESASSVMEAQVDVPECNETCDKQDNLQLQDKLTNEPISTFDESSNPLPATGKAENKEERDESLLSEPMTEVKDPSQPLPADGKAEHMKDQDEYSQREGMEDSVPKRHTALKRSRSELRQDSPCKKYKSLGRLGPLFQSSSIVSRIPEQKLKASFLMQSPTVSSEEETNVSHPVRVSRDSDITVELWNDDLGVGHVVRKSESLPDFMGFTDANDMFLFIEEIVFLLSENMVKVIFNEDYDLMSIEHAYLILQTEMNLICYKVYRYFLRENYKLRRYNAIVNINMVSNTVKSKIHAISLSYNSNSVDTKRDETMGSCKIPEIKVNRQVELECVTPDKSPIIIEDNENLPEVKIEDECTEGGTSIEKWPYARASTFLPPEGSAQANEVPVTVNVPNRQILNDIPCLTQGGPLVRPDKKYLPPNVYPTYEKYSTSLLNNGGDVIPEIEPLPTSTVRHNYRYVNSEIRKALRMKKMASQMLQQAEMVLNRKTCFSTGSLDHQQHSFNSSDESSEYSSNASTPIPEDISEESYQDSPSETIVLSDSDEEDDGEVRKKAAEPVEVLCDSDNPEAKTSSVSCAKKYDKPINSGMKIENSDNNTIYILTSDSEDDVIVVPDEVCDADEKVKNEPVLTKDEPHVNIKSSVAENSDSSVEIVEGPLVDTSGCISEESLKEKLNIFSKKPSTSQEPSLKVYFEAYKATSDISKNPPDFNIVILENPSVPTALQRKQVKQHYGSNIPFIYCFIDSDNEVLYTYS